jgi:hypothetical protein
MNNVHVRRQGPAGLCLCSDNHFQLAESGVEWRSGFGEEEKEIHLHVRLGDDGKPNSFGLQALGFETTLTSCVDSPS